MGNKINDPIARLMGLRYKSHPWHGIEVGEEAPEVLTAFIEMVPTDTVKYELDKVCGYIKIDRPQKYSNVVPALYGFIPQSYCGDSVAEYAMQQSQRSGIKGDCDPLDICVLTERTIAHGDIIASVRPIGGFRMFDGDEADDKIIAVLKHDATYNVYNGTFAENGTDFSSTQLSFTYISDFAFSYKENHVLDSIDKYLDYFNFLNDHDQDDQAFPLIKIKFKVISNG